MTPVAASIVSPAGRPVADQVSVSPGRESVAPTANGVIAPPDTELCAPGEVTLTELVTVQVKVAEAVVEAESTTETVTWKVPAVVGVPVMMPVEELMARPTGSPVADQVSVAVDDESVAPTTSPATDTPEPLSWFPGEVTVRMLVMVQVKLDEAAKPLPSVAVTVTG